MARLCGFCWRFFFLEKHRTALGKKTGDSSAAGLRDRSQNDLVLEACGAGLDCGAGLTVDRDGWFSPMREKNARRNDCSPRVLSFGSLFSPRRYDAFRGRKNASKNPTNVPFYFFKLRTCKL
jgi:hypothetical protein